MTAAEFVQRIRSDRSQRGPAALLYGEEEERIYLQALLLLRRMLAYADVC
jgi:hypothetical protein